MPRGYPNPKPATVAVPSGPAPMVLIEPLPDGAIRFNGYGLDSGEIVALLRRCLVHVVASQAGVQVISLEVPARAAVATPARNGKRPAAAAAVDPTAPRYSLASLGLDRDGE